MHFWQQTHAVEHLQICTHSSLGVQDLVAPRNEETLIETLGGEGEIYKFAHRVPAARTAGSCDLKLLLLSDMSVIVQ